MRVDASRAVKGYCGFCAVHCPVVTAVDAGTGKATNIGNLPAPRGYAGTAYAASNDTVYVFGGSDQLNTTNARHKRMAKALAMPNACEPHPSW